MMDIHNLVPKNKFDNSDIEKLKQLTDEEIEPILPCLLEWIKDYNYPIAKELLAVLELHQIALTPLILNVLSLEEKDDIWKYWIITSLLPLFSNTNIEPFLPAIKRIAENPTQNEIREEVDEAAIIFLQDRL